MKVEDQAEMKKVIGFKKASKNDKKKTKEEKKPAAEVTEDAKLKVNLKLMLDILSVLQRRPKMELGSPPPPQ